MISIHQLHAFLSVAHNLAELKQLLQALWLSPSFCEELCEQDGSIDSVCSAPNHLSGLPLNRGDLGILAIHQSFNQ